MKPARSCLVCYRDWRRCQCDTQSDQYKIDYEKARYTRFHWAAYGCEPPADELEDSHMLKLHNARDRAESPVSK